EREAEPAHAAARAIVLVVPPRDVVAEHAVVVRVIAVAHERDREAEAHRLVVRTRDLVLPRRDRAKPDLGRVRVRDRQRLAPGSRRPPEVAREADVERQEVGWQPDRKALEQDAIELFVWTIF